MKSTKRLWAGIVVLALLSPLGLLLPRWFGAKGAWGEWGVDAIKKATGFVPEGMKRVSELWKAPLPDYALPGGNRGAVHEGLGYVLSAIIGIALIILVMYIITKLLGRKDGSE